MTSALYLPAMYFLFLPNICSDFIEESQAKIKQTPVSKHESIGMRSCSLEMNLITASHSRSFHQHVQRVLIMNVYVSVLAIELLAACQAVEFLRPLKSTEPLEEVYDLVRSVAKSVIYLTLG